MLLLFWRIGLTLSLQKPLYKMLNNDVKSEDESCNDSLINNSNRQDELELENTVECKIQSENVEDETLKMDVLSNSTKKLVEEKTIRNEKRIKKNKNINPRKRIKKVEWDELGEMAGFIDTKKIYIEELISKKFPENGAQSKNIGRSVFDPNLKSHHNKHRIIDIDILDPTEDERMELIDDKYPTTLKRSKKSKSLVIKSESIMNDTKNSHDFNVTLPSLNVSSLVRPNFSKPKYILPKFDTSSRK
ncbi:hypothetical protein RDWZM_002306 [Blomia tropicalis]|uniref:Uncharacterized protein n=1 Tax=Blomia tropicalis TaxID=40697 RepID=A0A9Q0RRH7_BLOTA|nr:hypothetical protein RDWZM_002306 [Blomia tropicalis]